MADTLRISEEERKSLTTQRTVDRPKYTFFALDHAVRYSQANKKEILGDVNSLYLSFEQEHPDGTFDDWRNFYLEEQNGRERLEEATEEAYRMLLTIREALKQLDRDDVYEFIEGIALYGTYEGHNAVEAVHNKLLLEIPECEEPEGGDVPDGSNLIYGDYHLYIHPRSEKLPEEKKKREDQRIVYFRELDGGDIEIDLNELNFSLEEF